MAAPVNYTTTIAASKTVAEIQKMLADHGATRIGVDYEGGSPSGLAFVLTIDDEPRMFTLPVNVAAMKKLLYRKSVARELRSISRTVATSQEHAERVAWRIMKDWIAAQLALIESSMIDLEQVMLPYMRVTADGHTLYDAYRAGGLKELTTSGG